MTATGRSIAIVQYAGDYGDAYTRLAAGGSETYYAQRYSVDAVAGLLKYADQVTTLCCTGPGRRDSLLANGVRSIAFGGGSVVDEDGIVAALADLKATHICLRSPLSGVLRYALRARTVESVLITFADSFTAAGARAAVRHWRLARWLNHEKVAAIANHGMASSRSLERIGVDARRIVPWDWPHEVTPAAHEAKSLPAGNPRWRLLFVGILSESKGFGDCVEAMALLRRRGIDFVFEYAGSGDPEAYAGRIAALGLEANMNYLGKIPHETVVPRMREADIVIVPSRHDYPEGFPMTLYEALSSRTPIVASDHPMYAPHLRRHGAAEVYAAANPAALAEAVSALMTDADRYATMSRASSGAWEALQLPVTWGDLLHDWAENSPQRALRSLRHSLAVEERG